MNLLPDRYAYCAPPILTMRPSFGDLIPSEESASLWVLAWPRLLGWPRRIHWLFAPAVDSRRKGPGDLWGLDSEGRLIIIETKFDPVAGPKDPFKSFVPYIKSGIDDHSWTTKELRARWLKYFASERNFVENELATFWSTKPMTGTYRDSVPYSFRRYAVWRFRSLYCTSIAPLIVNGTYQRAIDRALRLREAAGDPPPVFVGLVASMTANFQLSKEGRKNLLVLQRRAGESRVHLRAINATLGSKGLRIYCWSPVTQ